MVDRPGTMHEWLYRVVDSNCYDREYLYRVYVENFSAFFASIYRQGSTRSSGEHVVQGLKGGPDICIRWTLERQISFVGPNRVRLEASGETADESVPRTEIFDLSTGMRTEQ